MSDLISRQAAIEGVKTLHDVAWKNWHEPTLSANVVLDMIRKLPSAQPRKGKWLICSTFDDCYYAKCDQCHETQVFYYNKPLTNFCPNCGCRMEEGDSDDNH